jgi:hypothetical protein
MQIDENGHKAKAQPSMHQSLEPRSKAIFAK